MLEKIGKFVLIYGNLTERDADKIKCFAEPGLDD